MAESFNNTENNSQFAVSLWAFWIKGSMKVDNNFIHVDMPNTVLFGLIPAGDQKDNSPLQGITNVYTSKRYNISLMFIGAIIALIGLASFSNSFLAGILLILIGAGLIASGIKTRFSYERSGIIKSFDVPFFESDHIEQFSQKVQRAVAHYQEDRNVRTNADRTIQQSQQNTDKIVDAMHSNDNNR